MLLEKNKNCILISQGFFMRILAGELKWRGMVEKKKVWIFKLGRDYFSQIKKKCFK